MSKFYITTTLPYVNADPHIGFALELIQADVVARYHRLKGDDVIFNTGTDEHGVKIYRKALEAGVEPQEYADKFAARFDALKEALNVSYTSFIRTSDAHHKKSAQEFWKLCEKNGDIYKKEYKIKYCVGCELEKTDSELEDGKCPIHPTYQLETLEEENYFFRFSKYEKKLLDIYEKDSNFIVPEHRFNEIKAFFDKGLQDFSISRLKEKMPWGVPVPSDDKHVMYVWFDALTNYVSTLGWPEDKENFEAFWPGIQVAGKDNLRQQTAMWQAMLLSAGLPTSKQVFIHGFISSEGKKMSKSIGNVVDPFEVVNEYGIDSLRFYLLGAIPSYDDGDFSIKRFEDFYTAHLVNGIGNLTSRITTMLERYSKQGLTKSPDIFNTEVFWNEYEASIEKFNFEETIQIINNLVSSCDTKISEEKPWEKEKSGQDVSELMYQLGECLRHIGLSLLPVIPSASKSILSLLGEQEFGNLSLGEEKKWGGLKKNAIIKKGEALFPRLIK